MPRIIMPFILSLAFLVLCLYIMPIFGEEVLSEKLSSELFQLVTSNQPENFAAEHGIEIRDERILVVIEFSESVTDRTDKDEFAKIYDLKDAKWHKASLETWILLRNLSIIAKEPQVKFIKRPYKFLRWKR